MNTEEPTTTKNKKVVDITAIRLRRRALEDLKQNLDAKLEESLHSLEPNPEIFKEVNFLLHKIDELGYINHLFRSQRDRPQ